jgi:hypothetical protein
MHTLQNLIVFALLVPGCAGFAAWKLMPVRARRALAVSMLRLPHLPAPLEGSLRKSAQAGSGCGCDGCDRADPKPRNPAATQSSASTPAGQPITFHRRPLR